MYVLSSFELMILKTLLSFPTLMYFLIFLKIAPSWQLCVHLHLIMQEILHLMFSNEHSWEL